MKANVIILFLQSQTLVAMWQNIYPYVAVIFLSHDCKRKKVLKSYEIGTGGTDYLDMKDDIVYLFLTNFSQICVPPAFRFWRWQNIWHRCTSMKYYIIIFLLQLYIKSSSGIPKYPAGSSSVIFRYPAGTLK